MADETPRTPPPYDELDPDIVETVRWLFENGFNPCDSGDGHSKFAGAIDDDHDPDMFLDFPNVFMSCAPDKLVAECNRLRDLLVTAGIEFAPIGPGGSTHVQIEGGYDPANPEFAHILLFHLDDKLLQLAQEKAWQQSQKS